MSETPTTDLPTLRQQVQEAHGLLVSHGCCMEDYGFSGPIDVINEGRREYGRLLDRYATAIRRLALAEVREKVEGVPHIGVTVVGDYGMGGPISIKDWISRQTVLDTLTALAGEGP